ncbi:MAG: Histidinol phosphate phosphatase HisJ family [Chthoniobacteraceae bacterium]|nr:Histidinol phosphate phosphatase HisJ family [Chthoniobacteraceae bacterium]
MLFDSLTDYHIHTPLCAHATGWPVEFAERALQLGFKEIGFADHNPMPDYFDDWRMSLAELPRYLDAVAEARAKFPQLTIRLGLECDYLPGKEAWIEKLASMAEWDFLIGSVHYLSEGWEVDHPKYIGRHAGEAEPIWESYWKTYGQCIRSGLFDFVAHPDLPKKFGYRPEGDLRRFYEPAIAALAECKGAFEINTAGLRKECRELYPSFQFVELARKAGIPVLINSDAHAVEELGAGFDQAVALARSAGYTETGRVHRRKLSFAPLPEPSK